MMADKACTRGGRMTVFPLRPVLLTSLAFLLSASPVEGSSGSSSSVGDQFARLIGFSLITGLWIFPVIIVLAAICGCCLIKLMVAAIGALVTRNKYKKKDKAPAKNADIAERGQGQDMTRYVGQEVSPYEELGAVPPDAVPHEYLSMSPTGAEYERRALGTNDDYLRPTGY